MSATAEVAPMISVPSDFASQLAEGLAAALPRQRQKVSFGEYEARKPKLPKLRWSAVYQNGYQVPPSLTKDEITALNAITHSGDYFNNTMHVVVKEEGTTRELHFNYSNSTPDARFANKDYFRNFADLTKQIEVLQVAEDLQLEERVADRAARRR